MIIAICHHHLSVKKITNPMVLLGRNILSLNGNVLTSPMDVLPTEGKMLLTVGKDSSS